MKIKQFEIILQSKERGFHLVTDEVFVQIPDLAQVQIGLLHLYIQHSSASISINEYADSSVRKDLEKFYSELCDDKHISRILMKDQTICLRMLKPQCLDQM